MSEPKLEPNEFATWKSLVSSSDWSVYRDLLSEHVDHLNQQALLALDKRSFEDAFAYRLRATEANKWLRLVEDRLCELKNSKNE